jgi:predicted ester cyclase
MMSTVAVDSKQLIADYLQALSGQPKTAELLNRFISDPALKEHIRQAESAFPSYEVVAQQMVAEGDVVAVRCTFRGIHKGEFAGIPATGRTVSSDFMIFYRVSDRLIVEHWMQLNVPEIVGQLTA